MGFILNMVFQVTRGIFDLRLNRRVNGRLKNLSLCGELWSKSMPGPHWMTCSQCKQWCHEECCTVTAASVTCVCYSELQNDLKHVFYNYF
jgi:hypothetical protein